MRGYGRKVGGGSWRRVGRREGRGWKSKGGKINKEGRMLVRFIEKRLDGFEWGVKGDEVEEFTFTGGREGHGD